MGLCSSRSNETSKCGKSISDSLGRAWWTTCATFLFLSYYDVMWDQLLNRPRKLAISFLIQPVTVTLVLPFITFNLFSYFFSCILKHTRVSYDFACKNALIHSNARQMLSDARQTLLLRLFFTSGRFGVEFVTRAEEWYKPMKIKSVEPKGNENLLFHPNPTATSLRLEFYMTPTPRKWNSALSSSETPT